MTQTGQLDQTDAPPSRPLRPKGVRIERTLEMAVEAQEQWIARLEEEVKALTERNQFLEAVIKRERYRLPLGTSKPGPPPTPGPIHPRPHG